VARRVPSDASLVTRLARELITRVGREAKPFVGPVVEAYMSHVHPEHEQIAGTVLGCQPPAAERIEPPR
jgi:hypothetical protein